MSKQKGHDDTIHALRSALGRFTTGVAIVTAPGKDARPVGMTINSFSSISLSPSLISWCIDRHAASFETFVNAERFSITVLAAHQTELAIQFATRGVDKFRNLETTGELAPVIPGSCAWFICDRYRVIPLGDHSMLVGEVREFTQCQVAPLVFSGGCFRELQSNSHTKGHEKARAA
jgi:flavin reductase (DIM6/NTAB) family NADH-FMN oxidoreductase RutF